MAKIRKNIRGMGQNIPDTLHDALHTAFSQPKTMEAEMLHSSWSKTDSETKYYPEKARRPFC